jgi:hypothetical protein
MVYEIHTETSSLRNLKIMPSNLDEIVRSWIRLLELRNLSVTHRGGGEFYCNINPLTYGGADRIPIVSEAKKSMK